jgi:hypothetical protein
MIGVADHIHDYMNKIEDMYHAESQSERFAKKGRSNNGHCFITLAPEDYEDLGEAMGVGSLLVVNIRLFCNDSKQDFEHSISMLPVAISLFNQVCPWVTTLNASQDGASNYGDGFRLAYPRVLEMFDLQAGLVDTPETGAGKDAEDQDFRQCQAAFRAFWNAGGNILSATDCAVAADRLQGPERGKMNRVVTFERGLAPAPLEKFVTGKVYRWHHHYDETGTYSGSTVHRYANVGTKGKYFSRAEIDAAWPTLPRLTDLCASV